ncbi:3-hydroxyacyl-CoA dehydrogenase family protein [Novosphingobium sp.]|uniref:3-hydroxyacyl-CoA dehydrogenase family protein n=1 Tax=Novosphingobium sp. TaxID=1874826 RepID=UPI0035B18963
MRTVAVIGAGQMGSGITQQVAQCGMKVLLSDIDVALAEKAKANIDKALTRLVSREKLTPAEAEAALARITPVGDYAMFTEADLIIEAATEKEEIKRKIFEAAGKVLREDAIMASNTSSIPITRMATSSPDPKRFIGLHFFNPVPVMGLIEVIPGLATSPETVARTRAFAESLGKQVVQAEDEPGFVVNRILLPMINEAVFVLGQGTASIADIDKGCRLGLNHPMGPLELADFVGLDTCLDIVKVLYNTTGDSKYRPAPRLISPFKTLSNCGNSSIEVLRRKRPIRVTRSSSRRVDCAPAESAEA